VIAGTKNLETTDR